MNNTYIFSFFCPPGPVGPLFDGRVTKMAVIVCVDQSSVKYPHAYTLAAKSRRPGRVMS